MKNVFEKEYSVTKSLFKEKIAKNHHNCLQYERVLRILCFNIFKYRQFCLNLFMDYCCLRNIPKLRKKHCFQGSLPAAWDDGKGHSSLWISLICIQPSQHCISQKFSAIYILRMPNVLIVFFMMGQSK